MTEWKTTRHLGWLLLAAIGTSSFSHVAADEQPFRVVADSYRTSMLPLLKRFCFECHNADDKEGELNLQRFRSLADVRKEPGVWESVLFMLHSEQMPPKEGMQPTGDQMKSLIGWTERYLDAEALANAGDPGRVVLRRLNNVEFDNTVRDLIGVDLHPSRQFPVDGAAGEGFVNTGDSLAMSPALFQKYMDAARKVAAHAVLLPDGIQFSDTPHRRDWVQKRFREIARIYSLYADQDGLLPLEDYLAATLEFRELGDAGTANIEGFVVRRNLNPLHFGRMWNALNQDDAKATKATQAGMLVMNRVRAAWRKASPAEFRDLLDLIRQLQEQMWKVDAQRVGWYEDWQKQKPFLSSQHTLRQKLVPLEGASTIPLNLVAINLRPNATGRVLWKRPRFEAMGKPPVLLDELITDLDFKAGDDGTFLTRDAPAAISFEVPVASLANREFVVDVALDESQTDAGILHVHVEQSRTVWQDRSRTGSHPIVVKGNPQRIDQAINGRPAVRFGDKDHIFLEHSEKLRPAEFSIVAVARVETDKGGVLFSNYDNPINWGKGFSFALTPDRKVYFFTTAGTEASYSRMWSQQLEPGFHILSVSYNKQLKRIYADGKLVGQEPSKGLDYEGGGGTKASLGSLREFGEHLNGELAELVFLGSAESSRRIRVEKALQQKYALPTVHGSDDEAVAVTIASAVPLLWYSAEDFVPRSQFQPNLESKYRPPFLGLSSSRQVQTLESQLAEFRDTFPLGLCFNQIKPLNIGEITARVYHREDAYLYRLMLNRGERIALDRAWRELHYIGQDAIREYDGFDSFIGFTTQVSKDQTAHFEQFREPLRKRAEAFRQELKESEPAHLRAVLKFANKAWRRPLSEAERQGLLDFYRSLRAADHTHEDALRLTLTRVFLSPVFLFRREAAVADSTDKSATTSQPVSNHELATRLSYFLWSTTPDERLRSAADAGKLVNGAEPTDELMSQTRRMLHDDRVRELAVEFVCQWMGIRNFDANDEKNEQQYPEFAEIRDELYEEPIRFVVDLIRRDGSVLELIDSEHTFVNPVLAKHYGIPNIQSDGWQRIRGVRNRGGFLSMGAVLAKQSGATRTSPILRGNWIVEALLGERLPDPPATVPELPDAIDRDGLSVRKLTELHTSVASCANCHQRIDPFGFALEAFDAIGRHRKKDVAGHAVDTHVKLRDGTEFDGLNGLKRYILNQRRDDFLRQFCRKLLGYALGRATQLSDRVLLHEMMANLREKEFRFSVAVETVIRSRQFRYHRIANEGSP